MGKGKFGIHGGQFVPEVLMNAVHELEAAYAHKLHERGGFDERIYLNRAEDKQA